MPPEKKTSRDSDLDPPSREVIAAGEETIDDFTGIGQSQFQLKKQQLQAEKAKADSGGTVGKIKRKINDPPKKKSGRLIDRPRSDNAADPPDFQALETQATTPAAAKPAPTKVVTAVSITPTEGATDATIAALLQPMQERLCGLENQLQQLLQQVAQPQAADAGLQKTLDTIQSAIVRQETMTTNVFEYLRRQLNEQATAAPASVKPRPVAAPEASPRLIPRQEKEAPAPAPTPAPAAVSRPMTASNDWDVVVFGPVLAAHDGTADGRAALLAGAIAGKSRAAALVGQLMLFQASEDRRAQMLKDIGELYYRWRPDANNDPDGLRAVLVEQLMRRCDEAGNGMKIDLVRPGDRFDSTCHNAADKGAEITAVFGWVVSRENGKIYTKASVAAH